MRPSQLAESNSRPNKSISTRPTMSLLIPIDCFRGVVNQLGRDTVRHVAARGDDIESTTDQKVGRSNRPERAGME